jgi:hypothetical protein
LVLVEQLQGFGGLGEDAEGFGEPHLNWISVTSPVEDVGDPVHGRFEPDRVAGGSPGNDQLQTVLGGAAEPHKPVLGSRRSLLFGTDRVGFDDLGLE